MLERCGNIFPQFLGDFAICSLPKGGGKGECETKATEKYWVKMLLRGGIEPRPLPYQRISGRTVAGGCVSRS